MVEQTDSGGEGSVHEENGKVQIHLLHNRCHSGRRRAASGRSAHYQKEASIIIIIIIIRTQSPKHMGVFHTYK